MIKLKKAGRKYVKLMALNYGLKFKWYHTTQYIRDKTLESIKLIQRNRHHNPLTYKSYLKALIKKHLTRLLL